ncbi:MAG: metal-sensing transcriptional repressor [Hydrogenophaga sp.]|uniref:metal-sensitive transcriptional regulator n=1 Tax=Hydrogenophaga sp. TaxID=1904254 RepID=UPI0027451DD1|nr:metal-sensing transcriptional repressor [Hydrogenophaga sp.]MDP2418431.1 metal-sensing transcriptional repressor [Hydrogenophaga sp.]MDZ4187770.1 metal-sensing transcriptional repressor [Hydrogenophaga sp.]
MSKATAQPLPAERKAELVHRLRRAEGQVRGLQKLLDEEADCAKIAQQLLATRHALDSTYVRLNLSVAEQELSSPTPSPETAQHVTEVLERLQSRLGRSR